MRDCSVAEATRGSLNEAANVNASRPGRHPTGLPTRVNSTSLGKGPGYPLSFELLRLNPNQDTSTDKADIWQLILLDPAISPWYENKLLQAPRNGKG